eukprot:6633216-Pyramimonas_sp.AAC.1
MRRVRLSDLELGTRSAARTRCAKLLYHSSHPQSCCRFSALNSGFRRAAGLVITEVDSQTSDAFACRIRRSELGLILELGCQTVRCFVRVILRGSSASPRAVTKVDGLPPAP